MASILLAVIGAACLVATVPLISRGLKTDSLPLQKSWLGAGMSCLFSGVVCGLFAWL